MDHHSGDRRARKCAGVFRAVSPRLRVAIEDIEAGMTILRHQTKNNESACDLLANGGTITKAQARATLTLQIETSNEAYAKLEAALALLKKMREE